MTTKDKIAPGWGVQDAKTKHAIGIIWKDPEVPTHLIFYDGSSCQSTNVTVTDEELRELFDGLKEYLEKGGEMNKTIDFELLDTRRSMIACDLLSRDDEVAAPARQEFAETRDRLREKLDALKRSSRR